MSTVLVKGTKRTIPTRVECQKCGEVTGFTNGTSRRCRGNKREAVVDYSCPCGCLNTHFFVLDRGGNVIMSLVVEGKS